MGSKISGWQEGEWKYQICFSIDVKSLSEILGHSNVSITLNTYVHSSMELKRSQLEKLN